jgi:putative acetyltransferase
MDAPPALKIRAARPGDAEAIAELQSLPGVRFGTLRLPYPRPETVRRRLEAMDEGSHELLAFAGEALVGMAGLQRYAGRRGHVGSIGMAVHDDWTGRGVGSRLLGELIDIADGWLGLKRVELTVYVDNAAAVAVYRKFGFAVEGRHRAYALRDGVFVDAYAMARLNGGG